MTASTWHIQGHSNRPRRFGHRPSQATQGTPGRDRPATVGWACLRLGLFAFGGPAAHIALFHREFVQRRKWLSDQRFLDLMGVANLILGPSSSEMALHLGAERAGWRRLLVAGAAFITPAAAIVMALAWAYVRFASVPAVAWRLYGIKPVVIALVAHAVLGLSRRALRTWRSA